MTDNPGHQYGACWTIRMAIEAASKMGMDYLIHTAEDLVVRPGLLPELVKQMERESSDYIGERWGTNKDELNSQFFGCRIGVFATIFDGAGLGDRWNERYMADLMRNRRISEIDRVYLHTHDPDKHLRNISEMRRRRKE
jgi:hypothetical protein